MCEPERTFKRFGETEGGARWDLTEVLNAHSEHIEKVEALLESHGHIMARLLNVIERMSEWQREVSGELNLALGIDVTPEDTDAK